jgi:hypothetical protein
VTNFATHGRLAVVLGIALASSAASGADVRGTLQGIDSLQPTPAPEVGGRRLFYWEEPNGAIDVRRPHANAEMDLAVIMTGDGVQESSRPVSLAVVGGRCRPGTAVVAPNGVLSIQNQDWFPHEFYAVAAGQTAAIAPFQAEATAPRSERQVQIPEAGAYEIRDRLSPLFRCFVMVGPGQGRVVSPAVDGAYRIPTVVDGTYTLRVYFEGRQIAETTAAVAHDHDLTVPAINLAAPAGGIPPAAGTPPAPGTDANAAAAAPAAAPAPAPAPAAGHHHHGGR